MLIFSGCLRRLFVWPSKNWESAASDHEKNEEEEEEEEHERQEKPQGH